jgi:hypothetical protein
MNRKFLTIVVFFTILILVGAIDPNKLAGSEYVTTKLGYSFRIVTLNTSVDPISPYEQSSSPLSLTATGDLGLNNVSLYYRWSTDNSSWGFSEVNDSVDSNTTDVDSSVDVGTETNFANAQDTIPDSDYMNIQESNVEGSLVYWGYATSFTDTANRWDNETEAYDLNNDTNASNSRGRITDDIYFDNFQNSSGYGTITRVDLNMRVDLTGLNDDYCTILWYVNATQGTGTYTINSGNDGTDLYITFDDVSQPEGGSWDWGNLQYLEFRFDGTQLTGPDSVTWNIDEVWTDIYVINYMIDFEYNWSNAIFDKIDEEVCFYVGSHTGSENLNVNYWTGSSWSSLGSITGTGWTNLTAVGLTSSTYIIQLIGGTELGDTSQDNWNIDVIMLHTWNSSWFLWVNPSNPDTSFPWGWNFDFPKGSGYYEFYSIGKFNGYTESTPASADAICYYNP